MNSLLLERRSFQGKRNLITEGVKEFRLWPTSTLYGPARGRALLIAHEPRNQPPGFGRASDPQNTNHLAPALQGDICEGDFPRKQPLLQTQRAAYRGCVVQHPPGESRLLALLQIEDSRGQLPLCCRSHGWLIICIWQKQRARPDPHEGKHIQHPLKKRSQKHLLIGRGGNQLRQAYSVAVRCWLSRASRARACTSAVSCPRTSAVIR